jgi:hypothetical protein
MASKNTYSVKLPDGTTQTRTSAREYTHARIVDFGRNIGGNGQYMATFHASRELADRKHPDFKWAAYTVVELV